MCIGFSTSCQFPAILCLLFLVLLLPEQISTNLHRYQLSSELSSITLETLPQHHAEHQNQSKQGSISSCELSREVLSGGHPCRRRVKSEGGTVQKALVALLLDFAAFVLAGSFYLLEFYW